MTYIDMSNDKPTKFDMKRDEGKVKHGTQKHRTGGSKNVGSDAGKPAGFRGVKKGDGAATGQFVSTRYGSNNPAKTIRIRYKSGAVTNVGVKKVGYGFFVKDFKRAKNIAQIDLIVSHGLLSEQINPIISYLEMKMPDVAKVASVSVSTVSRWTPQTLIGVSGSSQFFKIDELIAKGTEVFGSKENFKEWLNTKNVALHAMPNDLLTSPIGVERVDEALDAINYGNII